MSSQVFDRDSGIAATIVAVTIPGVTLFAESRAVVDRSYPKLRPVLRSQSNGHSVAARVVRPTAHSPSRTPNIALQRTRPAAAVFVVS